MRKFKAKYTWKEHQSNHLPILNVNDQVEIQKGFTFKVLDVFKVDDRKAYWTDKIGIVYADELVKGDEDKEHGLTNGEKTA